MPNKNKSTNDKSTKTISGYKNIDLFNTDDNKTEPVLAEFHGHILDNADGYYTMHEAIEHCEELNVGFAVLLQHNTYRAWMDFIKQHNLPNTSVFHNINGVIAVVGAEFTVRDTENENFKGNPVKMHLIAIGPKLTKDSPIVKLMRIKERNDKLVDYGLLNYISKTRGITFDEDAIKEYVLEKRKEVSGFNTFGTNDTVEFLKKHNITIAKSERELREILDKAPRVQRLNIELKDFMKIAHASGAMVIFAHPPANLCRAPIPEKTIRNFIRLGGAGFELNCNSMDNNWFTLIMKTIQKITPKYKLIFPAASDCHIISEDVKYGQNIHGKITLESQSEAIGEVIQLEKARRMGKLTHRPFEISRKEIDEIIEKYASLGKESEKKYNQSLNHKSTKGVKLAKYKNEEIDTLNPKNFKTFDDYIRACMIEDSYEDTSTVVESEQVNVDVQHELNEILDDGDNTM